MLSLHEMFGAAGRSQPVQHVLDENELVDGVDELGVLLYGHAKNAYWYGSRLSLEGGAPAGALSERDRAAGDVGGARRHGLGARKPEAGIVETDEMDHAAASKCSVPISGRSKGYYTDWTPLDGRPGLFAEDIDRDDPWQFRNILVR